MATEAGLYPCWEFLECEGERPQSRSGHTCALHQNRYLYIFGGFDGSNCFDDLYVLDIETKQWRKIEAGGERPSGRASHSAVTDDVAGVMYIFGGSGSHFGYTNKRDLCEFCFETECWRLLSSPIEDTPSARYGQSMVAYQEGLYVWGGTHGTNYPTDMHRFDLCSKQWEYVGTSGDLPCGRYRHQAMVWDDYMYIVGGSGINRYGDVFTFHFKTTAWCKLACTGTDLSDGRYAHSAVLRDGCIYLYGGNDGVRHDDLQQLDLDTRVWSRVVVHGECPPGRDFHAAVLRRDSMTIFGGSNGTQRHNDVFEFHMTPNNPPCTLSADLEVLLEQAQTDEAAQVSCDVFLAADGGESSQGVYCHSHLLFVRCTRLYQLAQAPCENDASPTALGDAVPAPLGLTTAGVDSKPNSSDSSPLDKCSSWAAPRNQWANSTDQEGGSDGAGVGSGPRRAGNRPPPGWNVGRPQHCVWVPVGMPQAIILHLLRYLYAETTRFGRLSIEQLFRLFLAAQDLEVPRLVALCERQIKVRMGLDNVLPLMRAASHHGPAAQTVQDACKHFFLANYNQCTELQECEALDPKLLCELMRLHNSRTSAAANGEARQCGTSGAIGSNQPPSTLTLSSPGATTVRAESESDGLSRQSSFQHTSLLVGQPPLPRETLAKDLKRLLVEEVAPDFKVVVQDEVIHAHKFMLVARSGYFASCILTSGMLEAQAGRLVIPSTSAMTADAFRAFLRFLYADDDILGILSPHTGVYLVDASSFYGLANLRLKHFCENCVRESFNEAHVLELFEASSRLNVEAVRDMALKFIISHFHSVCQQPALEQLDKPLLVEILRGIADRMPLSANSFSESVPQSLG